MADERLGSRPMAPRSAKVVVRFDQQQVKLLDFLRQEGTFGTDNSDIIRNVVLDYLAQQTHKARDARPTTARASTRAAAQRQRSGKTKKARRRG
jgi:Arc/MetJ-type ribon-helix-helix transcriptional regulator